MRKIATALVSAGLLVAVLVPSERESQAEEAGFPASAPYSEPAMRPEADPKKGEACCERTWCVEREGACERVCDRDFKPGSRKWLACRDYCSKEVHRCGTCCSTHRAPDCNLYCWGR